MRSGLPLAPVLCNTTGVRRKIMKSKMTGAAGLAVAFVAGMLVATAFGGWTAGARAQSQTDAKGQQVTVARVINPMVTDEDIALLRQDLRARKMQVIGANMALTEDEGQKFWPIYNH